MTSSTSKLMSTFFISVIPIRTYLLEYDILS